MLAVNTSSILIRFFVWSLFTPHSNQPQLFSNRNVSWDFRPLKHLSVEWITLQKSTCLCRLCSKCSTRQSNKGSMYVAYQEREDGWTQRKFIDCLLYGWTLDRYKYNAGETQVQHTIYGIQIKTYRRLLSHVQILTRWPSVCCYTWQVCVILLRGLYRSPILTSPCMYELCLCCIEMQLQNIKHVQCRTCTYIENSKGSQAR